MKEGQIRLKEKTPWIWRLIGRWRNSKFCSATKENLTQLRRHLDSEEKKQSFQSQKKASDDSDIEIVEDLPETPEKELGMFN